MRNARIESQWKYGHPPAPVYCLVGTGEGYPVEGLPLGQTIEEARESLHDFNNRRRALNLRTFQVSEL